MLCFLARLFVVFFSLVIAVVCYRAMQRVTVIKGLNCTKITTVFYSTVINLPLNERQCLVQAKQDAIKSHDNLRQKTSVFFL